MWRRTLSYFGFGDEEYDEYEKEDDESEFDAAPPTVRKITRYPDLDRINRVERFRRGSSTALKSVAAPQAKVHIIEPASFNDAQEIGDKYKANIPVIINLQLSDADLSKRLIDFASGLTYALDGGIEKVAEKVFLLTPSNVEVSAEEKRRLREKGFFNQM
ncbi:MAG: cell division protein SepF [Actinobacteria bacterium]|nr:cell division protein SepF [Actinomycetota bacterium]